MPNKESRVKSQESRVQGKKTFPFPLSPFPCTGYTLVELLIVIAIIAILSMTSFVYFNNFGVNQGVDRNVLIIQNAIKIAQTNASTGLKCRNSSGALSDPTGWIVEFSGTSINPNINLICKSASTEVTVRSYILDSKASLDSILTTDTSSTGCATDSGLAHTTAIFYGSVSGQNKFIFNRVANSIDGSCATSKGVKITVNYNGSTAPKTFGLNLTGAINEVIE